MVDAKEVLRYTRSLKVIRIYRVWYALVQAQPLTLPFLKQWICLKGPLWFLIADLLLKVVKKGCAAKWSFSNLTSIIRLHLMTYIDLFAFLHCPEKSLLTIINQKKHT